MEGKEGKKEKKIKIEISKLAFVFIVLVILCLLVWSFIIGVWVGTKIVSKEEEEIAFEQNKELVETPPLISQSTSVSNETETSKEVSDQSKLPSSVPPTPVPAPAIAPKTEVSSKKIGAKELEKKVKKKVTPKYTKKEVAVIASHIKNIKTPYYTLQIGAFSTKKFAKELQELAKNKGYKALIKIFKQPNGKVLYKVFVGKFLTRREAEKYIEKVHKDLGIKPFIVEVR
jgi:cell division septation protein DedD